MIGPIRWEEFDDRQTEKFNPYMPYDTFACFAGLNMCSYETSFI